MAYKARVEEFEQILQKDVVDMNCLQKLCFQGIPEEKGLRSICWKLLFDYLPQEREKWDKILNENRKLYSQFIDEMIITPGRNEDIKDHPLNLNPDSEWNTFFKDNEVLSQIDKDVRRLNPEISFFQQATDFPCYTIVNSKGNKRLSNRVKNSTLNFSDVERKGLGPVKIALSSRKCIDDYPSLEEGSEAHWEVVERILFLYAKLNPGQGYVQGMNEIIGPIYYCFASDAVLEFREFAEADSFFVFTKLMSEIRDFFIKTLDEAECGIGHLMRRVSHELSRMDREVHHHLNKMQLHPEYYSFRLIREELLKGDFSNNVKLLQTEHSHCVACSEVITDKYLLQVSDQTWHVQCLRCCICQLVLEKQPSCFIKDDSIYCKQDYAKSFGSKCSKCCRVITASDWVRKARNHVYHLACFACDACKRQLSTGEEFALHEDRVLCKTHYLELVDGGTTSSDEGGDSEGYHSKSKAKRVRTTFTEEQLQVLQANFQLDSNPDGQDLERIAQITGLSKRVTQVWFQNSRARQKKHLHTNKVKPSLSHAGSSVNDTSSYSRQINLHLTYSFQQQHQQMKVSPIYATTHHSASESSMDELSQESMLLCSMRGETI